ncbi:MAG: EamA family transporter [Caenispirillum bisanense]|nr:EamA family transporter [Caenispirillum bisanense]MCA1972516.1 EamA family transporter [Caenispirillum sp.]
MVNQALYVAVVLIWGSTWIAVKYQVGVVAPEVSVALRFLLAAAMLMAWCGVRRLPMRFTGRQHLFMAAQGLGLFCLNYIPMYWAAQWLTSGLLAVAFSCVIVFNLFLGAVFLGHRIEPRVALGAVVGLAGIALVFWPELRGVDLTDRVTLGVALALLGTLAASGGMMISSRNQKSGLPVLQTNAFGMLYGGVATALYVTLAPGIDWAWDGRTEYAAALVYLALFGSVLGFGFYLTLLGRIGPARASYASVLFPVIALGISTVLEGYHWPPVAVAGMALVLAGNVLVLTRGKVKLPLPAAPVAPVAAKQGDGG